MNDPTTLCSEKNTHLFSNQMFSNRVSVGLHLCHNVDSTLLSSILSVTYWFIQRNEYIAHLWYICKNNSNILASWPPDQFYKVFCPPKRAVRTMQSAHILYAGIPTLHISACDCRQSCEQVRTSIAWVIRPQWLHNRHLWTAATVWFTAGFKAHNCEPTQTFSVSSIDLINSLHSGLFEASSIASSKVRLCWARSFFRVAIQEVQGRPTGLLHSLWGTAVRILLASADSSILTRWPNSVSLLFCMIVVRGGCSVRRRTSQLETRWYQHISRNLLRHHWSSASTFLASTLNRAQHSDTYNIIGKMPTLYSFSLVLRESRDYQMQLSDFLHRTASETTATVNVVATENWGMC